MYLSIQSVYLCALIKHSIPWELKSSSSNTILIDKPAKYRLLFKSLHDFGYPYTYRYVVYIWKSCKEPSKHCIIGTANCVKTLSLHKPTKMYLFKVVMFPVIVSTAPFLQPDGCILSTLPPTIGTMRQNRLGIDPQWNQVHRSQRVTKLWKILGDEQRWAEIDLLYCENIERKEECPFLTSPRQGAESPRAMET